MDRLDEVLDLREEWGPFPELRVDDALNPFKRRLILWSATAQYLYEIALLASGPPEVREWEKRLKEVERIARHGLSEPRNFGDAPMLYGFSITAEVQPALVFVEMFKEETASAFPSEQLYGSLALWILIQAYRAALEDRISCASQLETQAAMAIAFSLGEGGRTVLGQFERERRSKSAAIGGNASHEAQNSRKRKLLEEFREGGWSSKSKAAAMLAPKYAFSEETVLRWLRDETLKSPSAAN